MIQDSEDPLIHEATRVLQVPVAVRPGLRERTLRLGARRRRRNLGIAGSFAVALLLMVGMPRGADAGAVTFALDAPDSHGVEVVGDFTGWQDHAIPLKRDRHGRWHATVSLPPGRYRFAYLVDGREWRADPRATRVTDDFGQATSVLTVAN